MKAWLKKIGVWLLKKGIGEAGKKLAPLAPTATPRKRRKR